ncbi:hypothetical protein [Deinococcus ruber]|nr:hypothetical protein [Deinococcus ruber]
MIIEPAPSQPERFLDRLRALDDGDPHGLVFSPQPARLDFQPHAYVACINVYQDADRADTLTQMRQIIQMNLTRLMDTQEGQAWLAEIRGHANGRFVPEPRLTDLRILNLDLRGLPQGLDVPLPAMPAWALPLLTRPQGRKLSQEDARFVDPLDSLLPPPELEEGLPLAVRNRLAVLQEDREGSSVEALPWELEEDPRRDLTPEELALFQDDVRLDRTEGSVLVIPFDHDSDAPF